MHARRIFWKLYPSYLIVTLLALAAVFRLSSGAVSRLYEQQTAGHLEEQALLIEEHARGLFADGDATGLRQVGEVFGARTAARITLISSDGTVAGDSEKSADEMGNHRDRPEIETALAGHVGLSRRHSNTLRKSMMYVAVPVRSDGAVIGVVRAAMPLTEMDQVLAVVQQRIIFGGLIVLLLAAVVSLVISRRISRPLERIKQGAALFAQGDFSHRLRTLGSAEINSLTETMNEMADQLEERLETVGKERNQREAVLSSMVEGVLAVDTDGQIISLNKAAVKFFHVIEPASAPGRSIEEVFRNVKLQRFVAEVLKGKETLECELTVQNGSACYLQARGANLLGIHGARIGAVIVFNDVTRLRRLENLRRDFVANVSHELKTPITSIKGFVETLLDGAMNDPEEADRFLKIVAKHADRLNAIIDDLLTLSRLEQDDKGGMEMHPSGLCGLIRSAVEVCAHRAEKKNITIHVECSDDLSAVVNPPLIEQALINLIGNAVKYSEDGREVKVSCRKEQGGVELAVQDSGYGISREHIDRLFERFYRIDKGRSRQEGGTGLGLAIVKHIAQAHGGSVSVDSTFGEGSTFTITLSASSSAE